MDDLNGYCIEFEKISKRFNERENEFEVERALRKRVKNQPFLVNYYWFLHSFFQTFRVQSNFFKQNQKHNRDNHDENFHLLFGSSKTIERKPTKRDKKFGNKLKGELEQHRSYIWFYDIFKVLGHEPHYSNLPIRVYTITLFGLACLIVWLTISSKLIEFNEIIRRFRVALKPNAWKSINGCVYKKDVYYRDTFRVYQNNIDLLINEAYENVFNSLGHIAIKHAGLYCYYCQMLCIMLLCSYSSGYLSQHFEDYIFLNSISFHLNPVEERHRLMFKLHNLVLNLLTNVHNCDNNVQSYNDCEYLPRFFNQNSHLSDHYKASHRQLSKSFSHRTRSSKQHHSKAHHSHIIIKNDDTCSKSDTINSNYLSNLIIRGNLLKFIKPNNLNANFYEKQTKFQAIFVVSFSIIATVWFGFLIGYLIHSELNCMIENRTKMIQCKLYYGQNATILHDIYRMWNDDITQSMLKAYNINEKNYLISYFNQIIYELQTMMTYDALKALLFVFTGCGYTTLWVYLLTLFFSDGIFFLKHWLIQLEQQFDDSIRLLVHFDKFNQVYKSTKLSEKDSNLIVSRKDKRCKSSSVYELLQSNGNISSQMNKQNDYYIQIHKALLITYLNFELFKESYKEFKRLCGFLLFTLLPIVILNSALCYNWVARTDLRPNIAHDIKIIWIMNLFFTLVFNYYVGICVLMLQKLQSLYRKIDSILAKMTLNSMQLDPVFELWRRQLMKETDIAHVYCVQVFGIHFSLSTLIGMDSYAFALWLFFASAFKYLNI